MSAPASPHQPEGSWSRDGERGLGVGSLKDAEREISVSGSPLLSHEAPDSLEDSSMPLAAALLTDKMICVTKVVRPDGQVKVRDDLEALSVCAKRAEETGEVKAALAQN